MPSYAKITLLGHVSNIKHTMTQNNKFMTKFSIAINHRFPKDKVSWFTVVSYLPKVGEMLEKGDLVYVEGEPRVDEYEGKYYTTVAASSILILKKANKAK